MCVFVCECVCTFCGSVLIKCELNGYVPKLPHAHLLTQEALSLHIYNVISLYVFSLCRMCSLYTCSLSRMCSLCTSSHSGGIAHKFWKFSALALLLCISGHPKHFITHQRTRNERRNAQHSFAFRGVKASEEMRSLNLFQSQKTVSGTTWACSPAMTDRQM